MKKKVRKEKLVSPGANGDTPALQVRMSEEFNLQDLGIGGRLGPPPGAPVLAVRLFSHFFKTPASFSQGCSGCCGVWVARSMHAGDRLAHFEFFSDSDAVGLTAWLHRGSWRGGRSRQQRQHLRFT